MGRSAKEDRRKNSPGELLPLHHDGTTNTPLNPSSSSLKDEWPFGLWRHRSVEPEGVFEVSGELCTLLDPVPEDDGQTSSPPTCPLYFGVCLPLLYSFWDANGLRDIQNVFCSVNIISPPHPFKEGVQAKDQQRTSRPSKGNILTSFEWC